MWEGSHGWGLTRKGDHWVQEDALGTPPFPSLGLTTRGLQVVSSGSPSRLSSLPGFHSVPTSSAVCKTQPFPYGPVVSCGSGVLPDSALGTVDRGAEVVVV